MKNFLFRCDNCAYYLLCTKLQTERTRYAVCTRQCQCNPLAKRYLFICGNKMPTRRNRWFLLQILLLAQHVSGTIMPIISSSRLLYRRLPPVVCGALVFKLSVWCRAEGYVLQCSDNRPWTSLLDIYHPDPWPVAATTVISTPDDGRRKRPKHVILQWLINILPKLHLVGSLYNIYLFQQSRNS